jgi:hypothetical protein
MMPRAKVWAVTAALCVAALSSCSDTPKLTVVDWTPGSPVVDADQEISISVAHGACDTYERASVDETAEQVTITAFVRHTDKTCVAILVLEPESVSLAQPLGTRELLGCRAPPQGGCRKP